jgi:multiple sugar transport system ATP-binding protein
MVGVQLKHVTKRYGRQTAVENLSLEVPDRAFLSLLGPSGCGKTTTLRMIAGLERGHEGEVWFGNERVDHLPANYRDISMVFQSYALYPHMNVRENMSFPLRMMHQDKKQIAERVAAAALKLGLESLLDRRPRELSGGQRQRVAIGRAMVRDASVFLMDEPLSNLDAQLRVEMRAEIRRLQIDLARTFIYVTHDQAEALTISDLVAVMNEGVLQQVAPPLEIYNAPANLTVARFIGSPQMNLFRGTVDPADGRPTFVHRQSEIRLPLDRHFPTLQVGREVVVGVRPEAISILVAANADDAIDATVFIVETLGSDIYLTVRCGETQLKVRTGAERSFSLGEHVRLRFDRARLHVFDESTGCAIAPNCPYNADVAPVNSGNRPSTGARRG